MPRNSPLITRYINYLVVERGLAFNTQQSYRADLLHLQAWASQNHLNLRGLTDQTLSRYLRELSRTRLNASSIDRRISAIRGLYQFLFLEQEVPSNPTVDLSFLKKTRTLPHVLTDDEVRRLITSPSPSQPNGLRDRAMLEILFAAGLRLSEAIKLRRGDVSLDRRILRCLGKGNKERQVPFSESAALSLAAYTRAEYSGARPTPSMIIFRNQGKPLTRQFAWTIIKHHAGRAGVRGVTPHSLRHTFATHLLNSGAPTRVVQELLGHASPATTELYMAVCLDRLRDTFDRYHPRAATGAACAAQRT